MYSDSDLHRLIKSLTRSEKINFSLYAKAYQRKGAGKILRLFRALQRRKRHNEELDSRKTLQLISGKKEFQVLKHRLYNMILNSLFLYHSEDGRAAQTRRLLQLIHILYYKKNLFGHCRNLLDKAAKLLNGSQEYLLLAGIYQWEWFLELKKELSPQNDERALERYYKNKKDVISKSLNEHELNYLEQRIGILNITNGIIRNEEERKRYLDIVNNPLLSNEDHALTTAGRISFLKVWAIYYYANSEFERAGDFFDKLTVEFLSQPGLIQDKPYIFLEAYVGRIEMCLYSKNFGAFQMLLHDVRELPVRYPFLKMDRMLMRTINHVELMELEFFIEAGEFSRVLIFVKENERKIDNPEYYRDHGKELETYYNIAYLYFGAGYYREALKWINRVINDPNLKVREDLQSYIRILNLLVHFEFGNWELLEYQIRSIYRFLRKKGRVFESEFILIQFIRQDLPGISHGQNLIPHFRKLRNNLLGIINNPSEKVFKNFLDIISWLDSKITGYPFETIFKRRMDSLNNT